MGIMLLVSCLSFAAALTLPPAAAPRISTPRMEMSSSVTSDRIEQMIGDNKVWAAAPSAPELVCADALA